MGKRNFDVLIQNLNWETVQYTMLLRSHIFSIAEITMLATNFRRNFLEKGVSGLERSLNTLSPSNYIQLTYGL